MAVARRKLVQRAAANVASLPSPVGGWNARDSLANMAPTDAVQLENYFPGVSNVVLRGGYVKHATGFPDDVETLMTYSGGTSYAIGDLAVFNGQLFYRKDAHGGNTGDTPFDGSDFWDLLAAKGEQGETGLQGEQGPAGADALWNFRGEYLMGGSPAYQIGDIVVHNGQLYYCLQFQDWSITEIPEASPSYWQLIAAKGDQGETGPQGEVGPVGPEPSLNVVDNAGTSITLADTDNNKIVRCTAATAVTITVPSTLTAGFSCMVIQAGAGQVTFVAGSGATLNSFGNLLKTAGQHAPASLIRVGAGIYNLSGNLV